MTAYKAYETMLWANHCLIKAGGPQKLTEAQKQQITSTLLAARSTPEQVRKFQAGVRRFQSSEGGRLYPELFLPPYNGGKKLKTIFNQTPKTQIFSANMYELEVIRLLCLLAPEEGEVPALRDSVLDRLRTTCFGSQDDGVGECFDTSLVVLRFLCTAAPENERWIQSRMENYLRHKDEKKRPWFSQWYYWLCLSEAPLSVAEEELRRNLPPMLHWLNDRSFVMHSEHDCTVHPTLACMLRNAAARCPEYEYIQERQPYIREKDGRLHFNMEPVSP